MRCRLAALALLLGPTCVSAAPITVFERVVPLETRTGVVRLRTVEEPRVEIPTLEERKPTHWSEARFTRLYALEFMLETREGDEVRYDDRGAMLFAVRAGAESMANMDGMVRARLKALTTDAFDAPLAGLHEGADPFIRWSMISEPSSWSCLRGEGFGLGRAGVYTDNRFRTLDAQVGARLCPALRQTSAAGVLEEIRSQPIPRRILELAVRVEEADELPGEVWTEDLLPLPEGNVWSRRWEESGNSKSKSRSHQGVYLMNHLDWYAETVPSSFPPEVLAQGAFVSRWTFEETERALGNRPRRNVRSTRTLTYALVPAPVPPLRRGDRMEPAEKKRPLPLDGDALRDEIGRRLDGSTSVDIDTLEFVLTDPPWPALAGFLTFLCRDDTASFGLPPTAASNDVTNASAVCAALEAKLP